MFSIFNKPPHKVGIALSGGGARGFAHAGALMALEQAGFVPDIIAGVSAGSVVAAMYASGMHPRQILESFKGRKFTSFTSLALPGNGLFSLEPFKAFLRDNIPVARLEDLSIPTVVGVTNFDTGKAETFRQGPTYDIITASCSIPIVFQPQEMGGSRYVDGGLLHNLPAWAIREECQLLIGINCSPVKSRNTSSDGMFETALRAYNLVAKSNAIPDLAMCDMRISIDKIADMTAFDLSETERVFSLGYEAALAAIKASGITPPASSASPLHM
ncbi:MAG: patatin-like phospholipase family protein [Pseudoflavonifractor sp.]|nr:patatin-like phospholipase family protein [Alloprevotella sp.]MCM1117152.1 patatin-like phospholipase family protein [Pseudoflavonifractor sp.]